MRQITLEYRFLFARCITAQHMQRFAQSPVAGYIVSCQIVLPLSHGASLRKKLNRFIFDKLAKIKDTRRILAAAHAVPAYIQVQELHGYGFDYGWQSEFQYQTLFLETVIDDCSFES